MKCNGKIKWIDGYQDCSNGASVTRADGSYCWQHDPEGQAKRDVAAEKNSKIQTALERLRREERP